MLAIFVFLLLSSLSDYPHIIASYSPLGLERRAVVRMSYIVADDGYFGNGWLHFNYRPNVMDFHLSNILRHL